MTTPAVTPLFDVDKLKVTCADCSLSSICLPQGLGSEELSHLEDVVVHKPTQQTNEDLYAAGDEFRGLCAIRSGSFKTLLTSADGTEQITGFFLPGELLGLDGLGSGHYRCTAVALETSSVCEMPKEEFKEICRNVPALQGQVLHLMGEQFNQDQERLFSLGQLKGEEKIATFLLSIGLRLKARGFSASRFNLPMTRHDIANYLGLAVETLSRILSSLRDQKVIGVNRRSIEILDETRIRELAHFECND